MGGNLITEVPDSVGLLSQLQALVLCDNLIENLPTSIARLKNLKSLLLHKNRLKHLPKDIVALKNLAEVIASTPLLIFFSLFIKIATNKTFFLITVKSTGQSLGCTFCSGNGFKSAHFNGIGSTYC